ncbi:sensor histidine kinase [Streptomyces europaeiscabiei]|uniref:Signal transduction histidine-protein kinase/phosphatase MprB n=1 Tax=Streptomyces europaeiscabiei TaxID=146819 RepID=A0ABU4NE25_9ACTN|nr:HAMP domain-containing sensor histidine kinase [Streptomyces europaeiscabiei]MDX2761828.1 HAMP domain-containing sensor histidine kinase [Streptomyces europaeiscabiei]MDX3541498.1 HAMP domain-containing sensor histidine kinase [Streptomyces europaeiscabiei]MDX3551839.1 HAMP domain-containing sensor histidine kinase [Streptomyces europaeiscabiei]MDX3669102.1 HAMP domain-containing sensor histidine kinase [Streptomyces europaeiscabiei]MDX3700078.1 HAMP domain-containing sensor histidine kinas
MRWALVKVCVAVTAMVVVAFAVPLGLVIKEMARDRAFSNAEREAAAIAPALSITTDREQLERVVASVGSDDQMAVHIPADGAGAAALDLGRQRASDQDIATVRKLGRASTTQVPGGSALLQPTALSSGEIAVVEVYVPESEVSNGVATAWAVLAGVGALLIVGSVAVADRLGVRMVRPAQRLVESAQELGEGQLGARVAEEGPKELRLAAAAFNAMADQVVQLLANERELAADLSHRLRTPLTVLRLNAASLGDGPAAEQTRAAVEQLEREVDTIIRTAREAKPQTAAAGPGAGCDAAEVVRERMAFWSALAEDEGRKWRVAGVERPVRTPVARADLAAGLDALLGNVFRHTAQGTAFAVDVHNGEDAVIVLVSDAGSGIADPEAAMARGRGSGSDGSTGLGLDIVRRLAESTGGDVRLGSSVLGGTEVRIWIQLNGGTAGGGRAPARRGHRGASIRRRRHNATASARAGDLDG